MSRPSAALVKRPPTCRSSITNGRHRVAGPVDGRSAAGRRMRDLMAIYAESLGGAEQLSDHQVTAVRRAAELVVIAETARAAVLEGKSTDLDGLVRAENMAGRAVRQLGIRPVAAKPKGPTLAEHLARRAAEAASAPTTGDA